MLSMPPAITTFESPSRRDCAPIITALAPEPQTLLTVVAPAEVGSPAPMAAWRAGAWPTPPDSTLPMITSSTCSGLTGVAFRAAAMAFAPS